MGLTGSSTGAAAGRESAAVNCDGARLVALAGNPNVGKSTLFNALTHMHQHTGNWPGKTVGSAYGLVEREGRKTIFADTPGTYSLFARSEEECSAREALLFGGADTVLAVCDATGLRRNMNLILQLREICPSLIVCVNLMDEARKKGLHIDLELLSQRLGVPVVGMSAGRGVGIDELFAVLETPHRRAPRVLCPGCDIEQAVSPLCDYFSACSPPLPPLWLALRVLEGESGMLECLEKNLGMDMADSELSACRALAAENLRLLGIDLPSLSDIGAKALNDAAEEICSGVVTEVSADHTHDRKIDAILTHPVWGWCAMFVLLAAIIWLTIKGANIPSALLSSALFRLGDFLRRVLESIPLPEALISFLIDGVYKTTAWVVSVMLPPMAIFFPIFTLLEDVGYLPRVAFNLDGFFKRCDACGKQALTMCMGFGCNAAGVVGCRIIDSPRERLIAALTNSFIPCNGRFPTMIAIITVFFASGPLPSLVCAVLLAGLIVLGILMTLLASKLLSATILKGIPSSFTLELPPYRTPKVGEVIVRSLLDRTVFVLLRALKAAVPAGAFIWLLANVRLGGGSLLSHAVMFLDAPARLIGLDGAILLAFIMGLPANEIVIPIILMCYLSGGSLTDYSSLAELGGILTANGWTAVTAGCMLIFTLMHWPCATTLMTLRRETGSGLYTLLAAALPTVCGVMICAIITLLSRI